MALVIIINNAIVRLGGVNIRAVSLGKCELYTSLHRATSPMRLGKVHRNRLSNRLLSYRP
jgi:hypothetical protein